MKTFTVILGMGLLMLVSITEAVSQPTFAFYYNSYGDRLTWDVPSSVLYRLSRVYGSYDIIHARQVPSRGFINFEVIIETRGRYVSVLLDHYGGVMNATQIAYAHFDHHICDIYCGFHANHYQRFYRPRPTVIVNKYPHHHHSHGYGYGNGHHKNKGYKGNGKYGHGGHGKYGHDSHGKYDNDHDKNWDDDGRDDGGRRNDRTMDRPNGSVPANAVDRSRIDSQKNEKESTGYRRGLQGGSSTGTRSAGTTSVGTTSVGSTSAGSRSLGTASAGKSSAANRKVIVLNN